MRLIISSGEKAGREIEVDGRFVIGRGEGSDLILADDEEVSREHAYLESAPDGGLEIGDLDSRNGTFVNGKRITAPVKLENGDTVRIGTTEFRAEGEGAGRTVLASAPPEKSPTKPPEEPPEARKPPPPPPPRGQPPQFPGPQPASSGSGVREMLAQRSRRATAIAIAAVAIAIVAIVLAVTGIFSSDDDPASTEEIVEAATPSTVLIESDQAGQRVGTGTGWVYDAEEGIIVTNAHVVAPGQTYQVGVDGQLRAATLLGVAPCEDLAALKVSDTEGLETLPLASGDDIDQGDSVVALGYPGESAAEDALVVTTGTVSIASTGVGDLQSLNLPPYPEVVQTDAAINPGNSGGPLIDDEKRLIGVNSAGAGLSLVPGQPPDLPQNVNWAVSVDRVKEVVPQLAEGDSIGYLGFGFDIGPQGGLLIAGAPDSTGSGQLGANAFAGETITLLDEQSVLTFPDYCKLVRGLQPGDPVDLAGPVVAGRVQVE